MRHGYNGGGRDKEPQSLTPSFLANSPLKKEWIINGADKEMIAFAEAAGKKMKEGDLTNSKIRSIYGEVKRIQIAGFEGNRTSFYLLKPKVAYAYGREKNQSGEKGLRIFKDIFDAAFDYVTDGKTFKNFCDLMEAILAYHRAEGGK